MSDQEQTPDVITEGDRAVEMDAEGAAQPVAGDEPDTTEAAQTELDDVIESVESTEQ